MEYTFATPPTEIVKLGAIGAGRQQHDDRVSTQRRLLDVALLDMLQLGDALWPHGLESGPSWLRRVSQALIYLGNRASTVDQRCRAQPPYALYANIIRLGGKTM